MKVLCAGAALAAVGVLVGAGGGGCISAPNRDRIAAAASRLAIVMNDSLPAKTAEVFGPASYRTAFHAWTYAVQPPRISGIAEPRHWPKGPWYVIVVRGRFVWNGPFRPSRGSLAARFWSPTHANSGIGMSGLASKLPASMSLLGHPTQIDLR